jgi:hypothetical protein
MMQSYYLLLFLAPVVLGTDAELSEQLRSFSDIVAAKKRAENEVCKQSKISCPEFYPHFDAHLVFCICFCFSDDHRSQQNIYTLSASQVQLRSHHNPSLLERPPS